MYLFADVFFFLRKILPGKFFELNINYGIFVGDNKNINNTDIFFGHVEKFRGCISDVSKNSFCYIVKPIIIILKYTSLQVFFASDVNGYSLIYLKSFYLLVNEW